MKKFCIALALILLIPIYSVSASMSGSAAYLSGYVFDSPGSSVSDWSAVALSLCGTDFDKERYLSSLGEYVAGKYQSASLLSRNKSTEWHRIAIAVAALGKDASDFEGINLINDGVFNRENLGNQGLNAYIWALIAAGSQNSEEPANVLNTYDSMLSALISRANSDGGFSLSGNQSDPDITAMAIYALAQFRERADVRKAIDNAINALSAMQSENGDFISGGTANAESTAQVITALSALGIDANTDQRFVKNSVGVCDALYKYDTGNGFCHTLGGSVDIMATYQAVIALKAYEKMAPVYKFGAVSESVNLKNEEITHEVPAETATVLQEETAEATEISYKNSLPSENETKTSDESMTAQVSSEEKSKNKMMLPLLSVILGGIVISTVFIWLRRKNSET